MSENTPVEELKEEAASQGKDVKTRRILIPLAILWLLTLGALIWFLTNAYLDERAKTQTLAEQIAAACANGTFESSGLSKEDEERLCSNADKVIEDGGEIQDGEVQESEIQESERQEPENQDPEIQDRENQNQELQGAEAQEAEEQNPELQDDEVQDPEEQEPEIQDPEIDDPDPNSALQFNVSDNCTPPDGEVVTDVGLQVDRTPNTVTYTITCQTGPSGPPPAQ